MRSAWIVPPRIIICAVPDGRHFLLRKWKIPAERQSLPSEMQSSILSPTQGLARPSMFVSRMQFLIGDLGENAPRHPIEYPNLSSRSFQPPMS
jgi:hypothetical protein